jgi:nucleotide-binding universal stress UspA family protein
VGPIVVAVGSSGLSERMVETVVRLAGTGDRQEAAVTVVHVARVWGTALGLQHPALQPSAGERRAAQDVVMRAALQLRAHGIEAEAVVTSGRDTGKALAATAHRAGASAIVVGRSSAGRLSRLLRGPDTARTLLDRASCTLIAVRD